MAQTLTLDTPIYSSVAIWIKGESSPKSVKQKLMLGIEVPTSIETR